MNAATKFKICDRCLGLMLMIMLASGIQLEATSGKFIWSVWVHVLLGVLLTILSLYHIYMHYRSGNWFSRFARNRNKVTRILWWVFLLAAVSGIAATVKWVTDFEHSPIGAVHGKIGFLMVLAAIIHAARHLRKQR